MLNKTDPKTFIEDYISYYLKQDIFTSDNSPATTTFSKIILSEFLESLLKCDTKTSLEIQEKIDELLNRNVKKPEKFVKLSWVSPSGKMLYACTSCGYTSPAPSKMHNCSETKKLPMFFSDANAEEVTTTIARNETKKKIANHINDLDSTLEELKQLVEHLAKM